MMPQKFALMIGLLNLFVWVCCGLACALLLGALAGVVSGVRYAPSLFIKDLVFGMLGTVAAGIANFLSDSLTGSLYFQSGWLVAGAVVGTAGFRLVRFLQSKA